MRPAWNSDASAKSVAKNAEDELEEGVVGRLGLFPSAGRRSANFHDGLWNSNFVFVADCFAGRCCCSTMRRL